jgi:hypothetical protein
MRTGRNDPCPCGSGKKYKKCCLASDEAKERAPQVPAPSAGEAALADKREGAREEIEVQPGDASPDDAGATAEGPDTPDSKWPPLADDDQRRVDAWWNEIRPVYTGQRIQERAGWLLERTVSFLDEQPRLFRHLDLHEEFLLELGGALADAGRFEDHLALLRRLRDEQPEVYFESFSYHDQKLLGEALRGGKPEDIPPCLTLFRQHPLKDIDSFALVVDLLAWRGCEEELRSLLEPTAATMASSPEVIGGQFGLRWLANLRLFPLIEAGDDSPAAMDGVLQELVAAGDVHLDRPDIREWFQRAVQMGSPSPAEAALDLKARPDDAFHQDVGWSFTGWVRRTRKLPWASARFLALALLDYWNWKEEGSKKPARVFGLSSARLDHYLARQCWDFFQFRGVTALSTLQAFHYFTEYLVTRNHINTAEADRLQTACAGLFEEVRKATASTDPALWVCPSYQALLAGCGVPPG